MFVETPKKPEFTTMEVSSAAAAVANKKVSYSIKKLLKQLVRYVKTKKLTHLTSLKSPKQNDSKQPLEETLDCSINSSSTIEYDCASLVSYLSDFNESHSTKVSCEIEDFDFGDISASIPVHFTRTDHGTFFWSATNDIPADNDLVEPLCCSTDNQLACVQDRWTHV